MKKIFVFTLLVLLTGSCVTVKPSDPCGKKRHYIRNKPHYIHH